MKKLLLFILIITCPNISFGQGVGIDIVTPTSKLDVGGNVRIRALADSSAGFYVKADDLGNLFRDSVVGVLSGCGMGFLVVPGTNYSIEINEHAASIWFDAVVLCRSLGAKLCSWEQWYYACSLGLPLNGIISNLEWTEDNTGSLMVLTLGDSNCTGMASESPWSIRGFRCCCEE
jgi:hypothetical protein